MVAENGNSQSKPKARAKRPSNEQLETKKLVYGVHAVKRREVCATQFLTVHLSVAEQRAETVSRYPGVLAAAVTRYVLEAEGQHRAEALYVRGDRQQVPYVSDDRLVTTSGPAWSRDGW